MFCTQCGNRAEDGDKFCVNCGSSLSRVSEGSEHSPSAPAPHTKKKGYASTDHVPTSATPARQVKMPPARRTGGKILKWSLRVIAFFFAIIIYLAWKELSLKAGMEGGAMGVARGIVVFGVYLAFVEWTKSLDLDQSERATGKSAPKFTGQQLATFVGASLIVAALAYYAAPYNESPQAVWWAAIIYIAGHAAWLWLFPTESEEKSRIARRWAVGGILVLFFVVLPFLVHTLS